MKNILLISMLNLLFPKMFFSPSQRERECRPVEWVVSLTFFKSKGKTGLFEYMYLKHFGSLYSKSFSSQVLWFSIYINLLFKKK